MQELVGVAEKPAQEQPRGARVGGNGCGRKSAIKQ